MPTHCNGGKPLLSEAQGSPSWRPGTWCAETGSSAQAGACSPWCPHPETAGRDGRAAQGLGRLRHRALCVGISGRCPLRPHACPSLCGLVSYVSCHRIHTTGIKLVRDNEALATFSIPVREYSFLPVTRGRQLRSVRVSSCSCFIFIPSLHSLHLLLLFRAFLHQLKHDQNR